MQRITNLLGGYDARILLRYHFLTILPEYVRHTLSLSDTRDLQDLAEEADRVFLTGRDTAATSVHAASEPDADISRISHAHGRRRTPLSPDSDRTQLCFYHARFGARAKKCEQPCAFNSGNGSAGQRQ
jgi:hypothetical protein